MLSWLVPLKRTSLLSILMFAKLAWRCLRLGERWEKHCRLRSGHRQRFLLTHLTLNGSEPGKKSLVIFRFSLWRSRKLRRQNRRSECICWNLRQRFTLVDRCSLRYWARASIDCTPEKPSQHQTSCRPSLQHIAAVKRHLRPNKLCCQNL